MSKTLITIKWYPLVLLYFPPFCAIFKLYGWIRLDEFNFFENNLLNLILGVFFKEYNKYSIYNSFTFARLCI